MATVRTLAPKSIPRACFLRCDGYGFEPLKAHQSGLGAFYLRDKFAFSVVNIRFRILLGLREIGRELGSFNQCSVGNFLPRRVANDHMRATIVGCMQPDIIGLSDL